MSMKSLLLGSSAGKAMIATAFAFCAMSTAANASLVGSTLSVDWYYPDTSTLFCSNGSVVVGAGVEVGSGCPGFDPVSIDITATQVIVTNNSGAGWINSSFNGFVLSVLSGATITSLTFDAIASTLGSTGNSFTGTSMSFNFAGQGGGGTAVFNVSSVSAIPLPAALPLLAAGLGALGAVGLRRRKNTAAV